MDAESSSAFNNVPISNYLEESIDYSLNGCLRPLPLIPVILTRFQPLSDL